MSSRLKYPYTYVILFTFISTISISDTWAQAGQNIENLTSPFISGTVTIDIESGFLEADLLVSDLPMQNEYSIWLNSGFNIKSISNRDQSYNYTFRKEYKSDQSEEAFQYFLKESSSEGKTAIDAIRLKYVGVFPVLSDTSEMNEWGDWKGNIAFNGKTIRATEQSVWYPILYNSKGQKAFTNVRYDLRFNCTDCKAIYLNGNQPAYTKKAEFKSDKPVPLLLFAGSFKFTKTRNNTFINTSMTEEQMNVFNTSINQVKKYYERKIGISYGDHIFFLEASPVSLKNAWAFVTYPTIANIFPNQYNLGYENTIDIETKTLKENIYTPFIFHELAHYYFGNYMSPSGPLMWFFTEGVTEYVSLKASKDIIGQNIYREKLKAYLDIKAQAKNLIPLSEIKEKGQIDEYYRYGFAPLLLTAMEVEFGEELMWHWINEVLKNSSENNYQYFKSTLLRSGLQERDFKKFEQMYINSDSSLKNIKHLITNLL